MNSFIRFCWYILCESSSVLFTWNNTKLLLRSLHYSSSKDTSDTWPRNSCLKKEQEVSREGGTPPQRTTLYLSLILLYCVQNKKSLSSYFLCVPSVFEWVPRDDENEFLALPILFKRFNNLTVFHFNTSQQRTAKYGRFTMYIAALHAYCIWMELRTLWSFFLSFMVIFFLCPKKWHRGRIRFKSISSVNKFHEFKCEVPP